MTTTTTDSSPHQALCILLRALKMPSFAACYEDVARRAEREGWSFGQALRQLCEQEVNDRRQRRIERLRRASGLPSEKTLALLNRKRLSTKVDRQLVGLCEGDFVERAENVLVFGLPGRGKTHLCAALGHELVMRDHAVLFTPTYQLVQRLLRAKRDLVLERELAKLDDFDAVILDDIGYVQQDRAEMEVLFTFLAQRYERRSVIITSNIVFSQWDRIFKDPMTTAAAIDRLVHHSVIIEMTGPSVRGDEAKERNGAQEELQSSAHTAPRQQEGNDNYQDEEITTKSGDKSRIKRTKGKSGNDNYPDGEV